MVRQRVAHCSSDDPQAGYQSESVESEECNWMGVRRGLFVEVVLDDQGFVRECIAQDFFTFL